MKRSPRLSLRLAVTLLAFLAFTCQSYLVQTHIHGLPQSLLMAAGGQTASPTPAPNKSPLDGTPADCPLCQDFLVAGSYVLPVAIVAPPPSFIYAPIEISVVLPHVLQSLSHSWQGRAPPRI
jgi:hypothetical protein